MVAVYLGGAVGPFAEAARAVNTFTVKQDVTPAPRPVIQGGILRGETHIAIIAKGDFSTTGTPTLQLGFYLGTRDGTITTDIALCAAQTLPSASAAFPWTARWDGICTGVGTSGTLLGEGEVQLGSSLTAFSAEVPMPVTAAARIVAIDTTIERAIGVSAAFSASSASNIVTVNFLRVVIWN